MDEVNASSLAIDRVNETDDCVEMTHSLEPWINSL
jgi:hypothetical protein